MRKTKAVEVSTQATAPGETAPSVRAGLAMADGEGLLRIDCQVPAWTKGLVLMVHIYIHMYIFACVFVCTFTWAYTYIIIR